MKASPDELSGVEQAVLLVLLAEGRPVPNPQLKTLGPELKKDYRERLKNKKLIDVVPGRPMTLELIGDGYDLCRELMGTEPPPGVRGQSIALYTLMKGLRRYFDSNDLELSEVFPERRSGDSDTTNPVVQQHTSSPRDDLGGRIRSAYDKLADRSGALVSLARLRAELVDIPRRDLDAALIDLNHQRGVNLLPQDDQKLLTDDDRAAAVRIGVKDNHQIVIDD